MSIFLHKRNTQIEEWMDDPSCDRQLLFNTYRQFWYINRLITGWKKLYRIHIKPLLHQQDQVTLLDIGFGGGDLPLSLHRWALQEGFELKITAIETDPRAYQYVQDTIDIPGNIKFRNGGVTELLEEDHQFDFVISNHLVHHLSKPEIQTMAHRSEALCNHKVIFNDIERSDLAYLFFSLFIGPFFRNSFAARDGRRSIRRSYTQKELRQHLPSGWDVKRQFPYRLVAIYHQNSDD